MLSSLLKPARPGALAFSGPHTPHDQVHPVPRRWSGGLIHSSQASKVADDRIEVLPSKEPEALFRRRGSFKLDVPLAALQGFHHSLQEQDIVINEKNYVHVWKCKASYKNHARR